MKQPIIQHLEQLSTERWARRGVRRLVRAAWLGVCVWCIGLGGRLLWGWPLRTDLLGALALAIVGAGVGALLLPRLAPGAAARRLDRRFHLDEQLATAVEVATTNPRPGSVAARLLADSGHTAELLRRRLGRRPAVPWHDLLTLAALALVAAGLWIISGIGVPNLAGGAAPLPGLAAPDDPLDQFPQEPQGPGDTGLPSPGGVGDMPGPGAPVPGPGNQPGAGDQPSTADPQVLEALADALRDQGATRPAAEALDRGDAASAARELRELADQASQLSEQTRDDLADRLRDAANQIAGRDPQLADQLRQSARGLAEGGQDAAEALDDLARAVEQLGSGQDGAQQPPDTGAQTGQDGQDQGQEQNGGPGQDQGAGQGQNGGQDQGQGQGDGQANGAGNGPGGEQRQSDPADRLGVEGQPVPLESAGEGEIPVPQSGQQPGQGSGQGGFTQGGTGGERVEVGADPLRVPIDERDVVQEYFQP
jgi:hypothetical protein